VLIFASCGKILVNLVNYFLIDPTIETPTAPDLCPRLVIDTANAFAYDSPTLGASDGQKTIPCKKYPKQGVNHPHQSAWDLAEI
jgi:hypothetical protein